MRIGRISVDFLGPVPLREAVVEISPSSQADECS
jgi:hypothetical protein